MKFISKVCNHVLFNSSVCIMRIRILYKSYQGLCRMPSSSVLKPQHYRSVLVPGTLLLIQIHVWMYYCRYGHKAVFSPILPLLRKRPLLYRIEESFWWEIRLLSKNLLPESPRSSYENCIRPVDLQKTIIVSKFRFYATLYSDILCLPQHAASHSSSRLNYTGRREAVFSPDIYTVEKMSVTLPYRGIVLTSFNERIVYIRRTCCYKVTMILIWELYTIIVDLPKHNNRCKVSIVCHFITAIFYI